MIYLFTIHCIIVQDAFDVSHYLIRIEIGVFDVSNVYRSVTPAKVSGPKTALRDELICFLFIRSSEDGQYSLKQKPVEHSLSIMPINYNFRSKV